MLKKLWVIAILTCALPFAANAAFDGDYAPGNWSTTEPGPAFPLEVDLIGEAVFDAGMPATMLTITSPDCTAEDCEGPAYIFAHEVVVQDDGFVSFDWEYRTEDGPYYDRLGVWRNGNFFQLIDAFLEGPGGEFAAALAEDPNFQSGSAGINVLAGDLFGFGLISEDSCCGLSESIISNFNIGPYGSGADGPFFPQFIPVPAAVWLFGPALALIAGMRKRSAGQAG